MLFSPIQSCARTQLVSRRTPDGHVYWMDPCSGGRLISLRHFRRQVDAEAFAALWQQAKRRIPSDLRCPHCRHFFSAVFVPKQPTAMEIDVCVRCQFLWFDEGELAHLKRPEKVARFSEAKRDGFGGRSPSVALPPSREKYVAMREQAHLNYGSEWGILASPPEAWQWVPALMGMPLENRRRRFTDRPFVTWVGTAVVFFIGLLSFPHLQWAVEQYAFYPSEPTRRHGLTLVSSFFLHGGWAHLLGNLYFLNLFGDDVEDYLGPWRTLVLLAASTVGGNLAVAYFLSDQALPHIGASGGIAGVMAFYLSRFPRRRVSLFVLFRFFKMPVWFYGGIYLSLQLFGVTAEMAGRSEVSFLSHLGGIAAGLALFGLFVLPRGRLRPLT